MRNITIKILKINCCELSSSQSTLLHRFSFQQLFTAKAAAAFSLSGTLTAARRPMRLDSQRRRLTGVLRRLKGESGELQLSPSETLTLSQMPK